MAKITIKQQKFADEYIVSGNATQAYINAGYSAKKRSTAEANARKLLGNYSVKKYLEERMSELESQKIANQEEVMQFLTAVMRGELTEQQTVAGQKEFIEVDTPIKDRIRAAELVGKRYSMWTDKVEQTNRNIEISLGDWNDDDED